MISEIKNIGKIIDTIKDKVGNIIYEAWKKLLASGLLPLTLNKCKGTDLVDYKIYGESVQVLLPEEYQQVEYIESTGTQYIDTQFKPQFLENQFQIKIKFETKTLKNYESVCGCRQTSSLNRIDVWWGETGKGGYGLSSTLNNSMKTDMASNTLYEMEITSQSVTKNGVQDNTNVLEFNVDSNYNLYIFATNTANTPSNIANIKLYSFELYQKNELILNMIPCYRKADNEIGMYDLVTKTFYTNLGTGTFLKGTNTNGTPTPEAPIEIESVGERTKNIYSAKTGVHNGKRLISLDAIKVKPNTDYIISVDTGVDVKWSVKGVTEYVENLTTDEAWVLGTQFAANRNTFNSGEYEYILIRTWAENTTYSIDENTKIQIEEGTTATEYEPYGYKIPVKTSVKSLVDIPEISSTTTYSYLSCKLTQPFIISCQEYPTLIADDSGAVKNIWRCRFKYLDGTSAYAEDTPLRQSLISKIYFTASEENPVIQIEYRSTFIKEGSYKGIQIEYGDTITKPVTTNIYLKEPLRKIGDYADYIDFENKKVVRTVREKTYTTLDNINLGRQGTNYNSLVIPLSGGLNFNGYGLAMSNYFDGFAVNADGGIYNVPDNFSNQINYQGTYKRCFASISNEIVNSNEELRVWIETLYNNGTPLKILYSATPTEETIELPNIPTHKGTTILEVDTTIQPSNAEVKYMGKP